MRILLFLAVLAFADTPAPNPAGNGTNPVNHAGNDAEANEDLAKELEGMNKEAEKVLKQVDQLTKFQPPGFSAEQLDKTKEKALRLANDDKFIKSVENLWKSENRNKMLLIQLGWFVFMLIFKAWRQSRAFHWFKKMLIGFACTIVTWVGLSYVIPLLVLGEPFSTVTGTLWRVLVLGG